MVTMTLVSARRIEDDLGHFVIGVRLQRRGLVDRAVPRAAAAGVAIVDPVLRGGDHFGSRHRRRVGGDGREGAIVANAALTDKRQADQIVTGDVLDKAAARVGATHLAAQRQRVLAHERDAAWRGPPLVIAGGVAFLARGPALVVSVHVAVALDRNVDGSTRGRRP